MTKKKLLKLIETNGKIIDELSSQLSKLNKYVAEITRKLTFNNRILDGDETLDRTVLTVSKLLEYLKLDLYTEFVDDPCVIQQKHPQVKRYKLKK